MDVTLLYVEGCPNWHDAEARVREAMTSVGEPADRLELRAVTTPEQAEALQFRGSPSILVDGVDVFADPGRPVGLSCRLFATPEGLAGAPTVQQLVDALRREAPD